MNFVISASKDRLLRRSSLFLRRLHALSQPQSPQKNDEVDEARVTQAIEFLQKTPQQDWVYSQFLRTLISSSPNLIPRITRRLPSDSDALNFFNFIQSRSKSQISKSLTTVLQGLFGWRGAYREGVWELYRLCKEWEVEITDFNASRLISAFAKAKMFDQCVLLYDELDPSLKSADLRNEFIQTMCLAGRFADARKVLNEMPHLEYEVESDEDTLETYLDWVIDSSDKHILDGALVDKDILDGALVDSDYIVELVLKFAAQFSVYPSDSALHDLIRTLSWEGRIVKACAFLDELVRLHAPSYTTKSCFGLVRFEMREQVGCGPDETNKKGMNKLLTEMKESKIHPSNETVQIFLDQLFELGMVDEAVDLFEWFRERTDSVDAGTYGFLMKNLYLEKRVEAIEAAFAQMTASGIKPSSKTYNEIFWCLKGENRLEEAFELMEKMVMEKCSPDSETERVLKYWLSKAGEIDRFETFLKAFETTSSQAQDGNNLD